MACCCKCHAKLQELTEKTDRLSDDVSSVTQKCGFLFSNYGNRTQFIDLHDTNKVSFDLFKMSNEMKMDKLEFANRKLEENLRSLQSDISNLEETIPLTSFSDIESEKILQMA